MKMLCVATLALLIAVPAYAQFGLALGPKAALVLSNASYDPDLPSQYSKSSRTAFAFGLQVETSIAGPMYAQVEVKYLQGGTIVDISGLVNPQTGQPFSAKVTAKNTYFELPVMLKAKFLQGPVRPFVLAGPSIGILLAAKTLVEAAGLGSSEDDTKSETNSTNFSIVLGAGAEFMATPKIGITAEARYLLGLSDVSKEVAGETTHTKVRGRGILIGVGALFHL